MGVGQGNHCENLVRGYLTFEQKIELPTGLNDGLENVRGRLGAVSLRRFDLFAQV